MATGSKTIIVQLGSQTEPGGMPAVGVLIQIHDSSGAYVAGHNVTPLTGAETSVQFTFGNLPAADGYTAKAFAYDGNSNPTAPAIDIGPFAVVADVAVQFATSAAAS